jgi:hypothetical protein
MKPLLVFEDIRPPTRKHLFTLGGVRIQATRFAWLSLPFWIVLGFMIALLSEREPPFSGTLSTGLIYGASLYISNILHSLGHIIAGKALHSPVDIVLLTSTRDVTLYVHKQTDCPAPIRIWRSLGGPFFNMIAALLGAGVITLFGIAWLRIFVLVSCAVGIWTLCPIPTMDGWVIWGNLIGFGRH